jgi:hypothetical protein
MQPSSGALAQTCVPVVHFGLPFVMREVNVGCVDDNYDVSHVLLWRVGGLVLALEQSCDLTCKPAHDLPSDTERCSVDGYVNIVTCVGACVLLPCLWHQSAEIASHLA